MAQFSYHNASQKAQCFSGWRQLLTVLQLSNTAPNFQRTPPMGEEEALLQQQQQPNSGEQVSEIAQQEESTQQQPTDYSWTPPSICFGVPPVRTYHFTHQFRTPSNPNNFLKGVKWYTHFHPTLFPLSL